MQKSKQILVENKIRLKVNTLITSLLPFIQAAALQCFLFVSDDLPMHTLFVHGKNKERRVHGNQDFFKKIIDYDG